MVGGTARNPDPGVAWRSVQNFSQRNEHDAGAGLCWNRIMNGFRVEVGLPWARDMSLRRFLRAGGGLAALALMPAPGEEQVGGEGGWRPQLALSSVMFSGLSLEAFCRKAVELGFRGIDLWSPFGQCRHLAEAQEMGAPAFKKLLARHGLVVGAYTTYRTKGHDEGFPGFAEFVGACGCGVVVRESKYGKIAEEDLEAAMRSFFEELKPEIALARKHGVRLAIENHSGAILDTLESLRMFTKLNPAPGVVGIALAIYHLQNRRVPVDEAIRACGRQLLFLYAWQAMGGVAQLPGHGPADFKPWLQVLAEQKFAHWITPFMHGELPVDEMTKAVAKARRYLQDKSS